MAEKVPPYRDRMAGTATKPRSRLSIRSSIRSSNGTSTGGTSTGGWRDWRPTDEDAEPKHKTLPRSWKKAVREVSLPDWLKEALLWLLDVPRWIYFTVAAVLVVGTLAVTVTAVELYDYLSKPVPIPTPILGSATETGHILAADGTLLADLHGPVNRQSVPLKQMSPAIKNAVLAAEDANFYKEKALDFKAILRAGVKDFFAGHYVEGGSTITQQYVKLVYVGSARTLKRKIQEARLAYQIERRLSKDQILERYLNTVYFGRGAYGVQAAALTYYNVPASQLTVSQASLLAGVIASPTAFDPDNNPEAAESRRQYVLTRMAAAGFISSEQETSAKQNAATLSPPPEPSTIAYADPYFVDTVRQYLFQKYGEATVLGDGLTVQTTLVPSQQAAAEAAVPKALPHAGDPSAAIVSVDPKTGYVTAMYGGADFNSSKFNLATQGRRQPGSAMKPFVLIAALQKGISPLTVYNGPAQICLAGWLPTCEVSTYNNESFGPITLEYATIESVNTVYAQLIMQVGPQSVVNVANAMGIPGPSWLLPSTPGCRPVGSPNCSVHLIAEPSLALGSNDVSPLEMASAYATLADHGVYHAPKFVTKVTNAQGQVLESGPSPAVQALQPNIVTTVDRILHEVVTMGTGTGANIGRPESGKTGTTSDYLNAWFVGYTPELATSVWVGYPNAQKPLLNVEGIPQMAGGTLPASLWASYMKAALPPATPAQLTADAQDLGLVNAPTAAVTSTVVGTETVTSSVTTNLVAGSCALLPSTTAVSAPPSPTTGTVYNAYPYLVCGTGPPPPPPGGTVAPTATTTPGTDVTPSPADTTQPSPFPGEPGSGFGPSPTPPSGGLCLIPLLC
ncbi:MAG TPA: transglycosylase domain-containing protein [Actinomycetota bacterium]|nr:transglycosylase domain-containing protein [Actinomycetota bacterium]